MGATGPAVVDPSLAGLPPAIPGGGTWATAEGVVPAVRSASQATQTTWLAVATNEVLAQRAVAEDILLIEGAHAPSVIKYDSMNSFLRLLQFAGRRNNAHAGMAWLQLSEAVEAYLGVGGTMNNLRRLQSQLRR